VLDTPLAVNDSAVAGWPPQREALIRPIAREIAARLEIDLGQLRRVGLHAEIHGDERTPALPTAWRRAMLAILFIKNDKLTAKTHGNISHPQ